VTDDDAVIQGGSTTMARRSCFINFGAGMVLGLAAFAAFSGDRDVSRASAQTEPTPAHQPPATPPRYRISAWAESGRHGAYILDAQGGAVWHVEGDGRPQKIAGFDTSGPDSTWADPTD
jgi:hypothetical protein